MRPRRTAPARPQNLDRVMARLEKVERRLAQLETQLRPKGTSKPAAEPIPSAAGKTVKAGVRCPGCGLARNRGARGPKCEWCGFVLGAVRRRDEK